MLDYAIRFILYDRAKSLGVVVGIIVSAFLIGQNVGVFGYLSDLSSALIDNAAADIWVVDTRTDNINSLTNLSVGKVREVASIPGVRRSHQLVLAGGTARFPDGTSAAVQLIGSDAPLLFAGPREDRIAAGLRSDLVRDATVSADKFDAASLGGATDVGTTFEISGRRAYVAVQTQNVRGFGAVFLYTTTERARYYGNVPGNVISAVMVEVQPGQDPARVRDRINASVFGVRAWLAGDLSRSTRTKVITTGGIGVSTGTIVVFAVLSGFFIIGLTMYSAALDRIRDYGTLKAIGATNGFVRRLILTQALTFALVGFTAGYGLLQLLKLGFARAGVTLVLPPSVIAGLLLVILLIALGGALFAIRRISQVEPASVFRT
jgi:putative ABC transport system permease protein